LICSTKNSLPVQKFLLYLKYKNETKSRYEKDILSFFSTFYIPFLSLFQISSFCQNSDRSNFEYWWDKMEDTNQNYYELVTEFDNYWENKDLTNTKGTGYKHFK